MLVRRRSTRPEAFTETRSGVRLIRSAPSMLHTKIYKRRTLQWRRNLYRRHRQPTCETRAHIGQKPWPARATQTRARSGRTGKKGARRHRRRLGIHGSPAPAIQRQPRRVQRTGRSENHRTSSAATTRSRPSSGRTAAIRSLGALRAASGKGLVLDTTKKFHPEEFLADFSSAYRRLIEQPIFYGDGPVPEGMFRATLSQCRARGFGVGSLQKAKRILKERKRPLNKT